MSENQQMPRNSRRNSRKASLALGGHLAIGLALGSVFALALPLVSDSAILALIEADASPRLALAVYVGTFAMTFGIGATLTGLVLETTDEP